MRTIGLTGGIGAGKSTVAQMLQERGAVIIDADQIARDLVEPGEPALEALVQAFGPGILLEDGRLSRGALAQQAFGDADATSMLNAIMHPRIAAESRRRIEAMADAPVVVYDMPLLVETGQVDDVDLVVVVDVPVDEQVRRAVGLRGLDEDDVRRRIEVQATREQRAAVAHAVIDNSGSLEDTREQVDRLWAALLAADTATRPSS